MQPIDEGIADIEKLDMLRQRTRKFQQDAIEALAARVYLPQPRSHQTAEQTNWEHEAMRDGWRLPGDDVEKAIMLQALLKLDAKQQGRSENQEKSRKKIRDDLLAITVEDCNKTKNGNPDDALDNVPIMRCAVVLQALTMDRCGLTRAALACFHRIVLELTAVVGPTWSVGSARAGMDALASAFITGECALALVALEDAMLRTADAAELIGQEKKRIAELRSDIPVWLEQEEAYRAMALYASLTELWPHLGVELSSDLLERVRDLGANKTNVAVPLASLVNELEAALTATLLSIPAAAEILPPVAPFSPISATDPVALIVGHELGAAARNAARIVVTKLVDVLKNNRPPDVVGSARVARNLRAGARVVHDLLEPIARFVDSIIDRELARPQLGLTVDAAELVFAACLRGRLSGWQQPKVRSAFQLARQLLTSNGRLLSVQPFNVQSQGYRLNVATLEATRRLSELAAHVAVELEPVFVETLMRPFEDTRAPGHDDTQRGWMTDPRGRDPQSEWWVTALAVDAFGTVIEMLNAEINRQVLQQFHVRRPAEIELDLNRLFYPDYGLTALRSNRVGWGRSVAVKLQELRIHAGHGSREETPRYSLVLYGPPGTGKTTLVEAIAKSADVPLVEITPSDILVGGEEAIERHTRHVFLALSMLTNVVILFDEFDPILQDRTKRKGDEPPKSIFEFLTPGMLPKLKRLHEAAKDYRVSYVLATNFVYNLDPAVVRQGRFDDQHGIYPPDAVSRLGRLLDQLKRQKEPELNLDDSAKARVLKAVYSTSGGAMDQIAKPGWYSTKKFPRGFPSKSLFNYVKAADNSMDEVRPEARFDLQWPAFVKQRSQMLKCEPGEIRELMSEQEKWYWDDWSAICDWDKMLGGKIAELGATVNSIGEWLAQWVKDPSPREAKPPATRGGC